MSKASTVFLGILLLAGAGCATTQEAPHLPAQTEFVFNAPFDKVWGAVMERATDKSWPIKTIDKASGILTTDFMSLGDGFSGYQRAKQIAYQPSMFLATWTGGARLKVTVFAAKLDETSTRVKIAVHTEVFENNVSRQWVAWESNGYNETAIADYIRQSLTVGTPPPSTAQTPQR